MEEKTLLSPKTLGKRWDYTSNAILNFEKEGIITRVPELPSPRYSIEQIKRIENFGKIINPFEVLEKEIKELKEENQILKAVIGNIKTMTGGF